MMRATSASESAGDDGGGVPRRGLVAIAAVAPIAASSLATAASSAEAPTLSPSATSCGCGCSASNSKYSAGMGRLALPAPPAASRLLLFGAQSVHAPCRCTMCGWSSSCSLWRTG